METRTVQRLNPKPKDEFHARLTQVWGGGMLQMSDVGWQVVQSLFDLHHMGAAEYEFGVIPSCLMRIARGCSAGEYESWSFVMKTSDYKEGWWRERRCETVRRQQIAEARRKSEKPPRRDGKKLSELAGLEPRSDKTIFVISPKSRTHEEVRAMLKEIAFGRMYTKNDSNFGTTLDPDLSNTHRTEHVGWLDLDNNLFWFVDEEVWKKTAEVFEVHA